MFCCGDYILHLGRHEVYTFAQICIFSFKATPFSQKYKFIILLFHLLFAGCCTSYYNIPSSLPEGAFSLCVSKVHLIFLTSTAFVDTKQSPAQGGAKNYKLKRALKSSRSRRASKSFQVRYSLKSSTNVVVPLTDISLPSNSNLFSTGLV